MVEPDVIPQVRVASKGDVFNNRMRIYIAGPYSKPDPKANTEAAIFYGDWVKALGHMVYIPHLTHYWEEQIHHEYEFWMKHDLEWLELCDAILRLPGESAGADQEVKWALEHGLVVFTSILDIPPVGVRLS